MQQEQEQKQTVKVGERILKSGVVVEYFCTKDGPTIEQCMEQVLNIAADALMRKMV